MNKTTKYVLIGVGVLALVGISLYASAQSKKKMQEDQQGLDQKPTIVDVAQNVLDRISGNPDVAKQRLANRKLRQSTKQAKLLKKGKISIDDLRKLQST